MGFYPVAVVLQQLARHLMMATRSLEICKCAGGVQNNFTIEES
jgi:hypothetical protein